MPTQYTMAQIRAENKAAGFHSFDTKTLKLFGETMRSYRVGATREDGKIEIHRTRSKAGPALFLFDPVTKSLRKDYAQ